MIKSHAQVAVKKRILAPHQKEKRNTKRKKKNNCSKIMHLN
jgi:hypothetical protein